MSDLITTSFIAKTVVDVKKDLPKNISAINIASGEIITLIAKRNCPVRKGVLRNTISYATNNKVGGFNAGSGEKADISLRIKPPIEDDVLLGGSRVNYATYVNFGTRKQAAQPFLTSALSEWAQKWFNVIAKKDGVFK